MSRAEMKEKIENRLFFGEKKSNNIKRYPGGEYFTP